MSWPLRAVPRVGRETGRGHRGSRTGKTDPTSRFSIYIIACGSPQTCPSFHPAPRVTRSAHSDSTSPAPPRR
eukprot:scaffold4372_cov397-Prasinococcus_capsulatus_cf.AAC.37